MSLTNSEAHDILDNLLGATTFWPDPVHIGLMTQKPNDDGSGVVEPVGNGYARVSVANNATEWPAASSREKVHANDITFPAASGGSWGTITHVGFFDAASGGNLLAHEPVDTPRLVNDTDVFRFLAASSPLKLTIPAST